MLSQHYLNTVRESKYLSPEDENDLARRRDSGDLTAIHRLVESQLKLSKHIARRYAKQAPIEDLVQQGNIGLIYAAERFTPGKARFVTYARYWVEASIRKFVAANTSLIRIGKTHAQQSILSNWYKASGDILLEGADDNLAERLGVKKEELDLVIRMRSITSFDEIDQEDVLNLQAQQSEDPEQQVARSQAYTLIRNVLDLFVRTSLKDQREQVIFHERLLSDEPRTCADIARQFKLSRERVRQIEAALKIRLKTFILHAVGRTKVKQLYT